MKYCEIDYILLFNTVISSFDFNIMFIQQNIDSRHKRLKYLGSLHKTQALEVIDCIAHGPNYDSNTCINSDSMFFAIFVSLEENVRDSVNDI
jgi:hypothetical protein